MNGPNEHPERRTNQKSVKADSGADQHTGVSNVVPIQMTHRPTEYQGDGASSGRVARNKDASTTGSAEALGSPRSDRVRLRIVACLLPAHYRRT